MKWNELFCNTFKALRPQPSDIRHQVDFILPSMPMVEACRADCLEGFEPFVANGKLTAEQVHRACERYYLGKTKSGQPIFWMIDDYMSTGLWKIMPLRIRSSAASISLTSLKSHFTTRIVPSFPSNSATFYPQLL